MSAVVAGEDVDGDSCSKLRARLSRWRPAPLSIPDACEGVSSSSSAGADMVAVELEMREISAAREELQREIGRARLELARLQDLEPLSARPESACLFYAHHSFSDETEETGGTDADDSEKEERFHPSAASPAVEVRPRRALLFDALLEEHSHGEPSSRQPSRTTPFAIRCSGHDSAHDPTRARQPHCVHVDAAYAPIQRQYYDAGGGGCSSSMEERETVDSTDEASPRLNGMCLIKGQKPMSFASMLPVCSTPSLCSTPTLYSAPARSPFRRASSCELRARLPRSGDVLCSSSFATGTQPARGNLGLTGWWIAVRNIGWKRSVVVTLLVALAISLACISLVQVLTRTQAFAPEDTTLAFQATVH